MSSAAKDTIYIDVDDEITSIIDKVQASDKKIVALVLPKRAAMLQSIVNMKLLKRSSDNAKKQLVLITSESGLLPLAGATGIYTAKTLQSKPEIPAAPAAASDTAEITEDVSIDPKTPIGELAGDDPADQDQDTIEVDTPEEEAAVSAASKAKPKKKDKKLKIPNFGKFRTRLILGVLVLILLVGGWYMANVVLPKATIAITTNTDTARSNVSITVRPELEELNEEQSIVPGGEEELRKTDTEETEATGEKDVGKKASGEVTLTLTDCSDNDVTIPAGTGVSAGGLTYITQSDARLGSVEIFGTCRNEDFPDVSTDTVEVLAQNAGDQYNAGARKYSVSGYDNVDADGTKMSGGTSKVIKVVRQEDVDRAKKAVADRNEAEAKQTLKTQLEAKGLTAIEDSFQVGDQEVAASPNVGDEANKVTITSTIIYTMTGFNKEALETLIMKDVEESIDTSQQAISDYGLDTATYTVTGREDSGDVRLTVETIVTAGPQIDEEKLKTEIAGKKKSETLDIIENRPGVTEVEASYSPFWVFSTPSNPGKITITFENAGDTETDAEQTEE